MGSRLAAALFACSKLAVTFKPKSIEIPQRPPRAAPFQTPPCQNCSEPARHSGTTGSASPGSPDRVLTFVGTDPPSCGWAPSCLPSYRSRLKDPSPLWLWSGSDISQCELVHTASRTNLYPSLVHDIEGCLCRSTKLAESGRRHNFSNSSLAGLRT